jgi:hypothetical protein
MHVYDAEIPSHKALPPEKFLAYPKEMAGKKLAPASDKVVRHIPALMAEWHKLWIAAGGKDEGGN